MAWRQNINDKCWVKKSPPPQFLNSEAKLKNFFNSTSSKISILGQSYKTFLSSLPETLGKYDQVLFLGVSLYGAPRHDN
jgi:hypothetical protein